MRAAIYGRFSTDKQSDSSIEDQARNCVRYAERFQLEIVSRFEDKAISGASKARPGYQEMLAAAERREFDVLLVDDLSRLSRDEIEVKQTIRRFIFRRLRIVGVSDGYDSSIKGEKIQSTMRGLMNELYLDDLREKTHRGLTGKALNGYSAGGRTYGYKRRPIENLTRLDVEGRPLVEAVARAINEDEARWVRQIFEWFAGGHSPRWIANELNRMGVPSARGSTWAANAVYGDVTQGNGFLNNQLYIGRYIWNRSMWTKDPDTGKRRRSDRPESEWIIKDMPDLRIVPQELWDAVQARQAEIRKKSGALREALNNPNSRSHSGKYLFSGLLKCGGCGANFTMCSTHSYGCATNLNRGESACANGLRVPRRVVEERLLEAIKGELFSEEAVDLFVKETTALLKQRQADNVPDTEAARRGLNQAEREVANIMAAIKAGIITPSTKVELERAEADRRRFEELLTTEAPTPEKLANYLPKAKVRYRSLLDSLRETLSRDIAEARECLKTLLGVIRMIPQPEGYLAAELQQSFEGMLKVLGGEGLKVRMVAGTRSDSNLFDLNGQVLKARMVAGAGFEPTTFRL